MMATPVNFQRLRWKIIFLIIVLLAFLVGSCKRVFAYTAVSDPNAIAFCTIAPVKNYKLWHWQCWNNRDLYNHVYAMVSANRTSGLFVNYESPWYFSWFATEASAAQITFTKSINSVDPKPTDQAALNEISTIQQYFTENVVLVYDPETETQELKKLYEQEKAISCPSYCAGVPNSVPYQSSQQNVTLTCTGSCANPVCQGGFMGMSWSIDGPYGVPVEKRVGLYTGSKSHYCQNSNGSCYGWSNVAVTAAQAQAYCLSGGRVDDSVAKKVVDDAATKEKVGNAMGSDAAKGATPSGSSPSGSVSGNGNSKGNDGLAKDGVTAGDEASKRAGSGKGGTTPGTDMTETNLKLDQIKSKLEGGTDSSHYTAPAPPSNLRGGLASDTATALTGGLSTAFNNFTTSMKSTALFSSTSAFFHGIPSGSLGSVTINGGSTFGSTSVNFGDYSNFFHILRGVVIVACSYVGIRILTKGNGG